MREILAMLVENVNSFARCAVNSKAINCGMVREPKKLEDWQIADAARLKALFDKKVTKSQQAFGEDHGIGTQGMVWQYLHGVRPLNLDALTKFAEGLGVSAREISPTLWGRIESYFYAESDKDERVLLTAEQKRLLYLAEQMDSKAKEGWLAVGSSLATKAEQTHTASAVDAKQSAPIESQTDRRAGEQDRRKIDLSFNPERRHFYGAPNFPQKDKSYTDRRRKKSE